MKTLLLSFMLALSAFAQECQQANELSTAGTAGSTIDNRSKGCQLWNLAYWVEGFTALTIRLEYSIDNSTWTATTLSLTDVPVGKGNVRIYAPYFRVALTAATGSGKVKYTAGGYKGSYGLTDIIAGGGGGGSGDVTAALDFGVNESILVADGVLKGIKASACKIVGDVLSCGSTNPGEIQLIETSPGADYISIGAPSSLAATTKYIWPATAPSGNQVLQFGTPSGGESTGTFITSTGGGGAESISYASLPGTCDATNDKKIYSFEDGLLAAICKNPDYKWYYRGSPIVRPGLVASYTAVNSPTEAVDVAGTIYLRDAAHNLASIKSLLTPIVSGGDWTITVGFSWEGMGTNINTCGMILAPGSASTNRALLLGLASVDSVNAFQKIAYDYATNYTTLPTSNRLSTATLQTAGDTAYVRVAKVGSNWTYSFSTNNIKFTPYKTEAQLFTATHAGFACDSRGDGANDGDAAAVWFHYQEQ